MANLQFARTKCNFVLLWGRLTFLFFITRRLLADGAELGGFVPVFEAAFEGAVAAPGAGQLPGNSLLGDDFHQASAAAGPMGGEAGTEVFGIAQVMAGVLQWLVKMDQVDNTHVKTALL